MKKKIIIIGIVILLLLGVSYAWINYYQEGTNKKVLGSNLYLYLNETSNNVLLQNVYPLSVSEAREETGNTISFSVEGKNTSSEDIFYEIKLMYGDEDNNLVRLNDEDLRFDLVEITEDNNEEVETYLLDNVSFDTINDKRIWTGVVNKNTSSEIVKSYRLRVWISDDILVSDTDPNRSYCATANCVQGERAFKDHYASVKIGVYGDLNRKSNPLTFTHEPTLNNFSLHLSNDYLPDEQGQEANDTIRLKVSSTDNNVRFKYSYINIIPAANEDDEDTEEEITNGNTALESVDITFTYTINETKNIALQVKNASSNGSDIIFEVIKNGETVQKFIKTIYRTNADINIMDVFPEEINSTNLKDTVTSIVFTNVNKATLESDYDLEDSNVVDITLNEANIPYGDVRAKLSGTTLTIASEGKTYLSTGDHLFSGYTNLTSIDFGSTQNPSIDTSLVTTMYAMFYNSTSLANLDLSNFDTSNVTNMQSMFNSCASLLSYDSTNGTGLKGLDTFDTSKVTTMERMFSYCTSLTNLDVSHFDTSNVTNMLGMFRNCTSLLSYDSTNETGLKGLDTFDTSKVTTMERMFSYCTSLTNLDVSHFYTSKVTNMSYMFAVSATDSIYMNLATINGLENFDTGKVTTMKGMFCRCDKLTTLDLSSFNTSKVKVMQNMFYYCASLTTIYVSDLWNTAKVSNNTNMFNGSDSIIGGSRTIYNSNYLGKTYARIDGDNGLKGYLTSKDLHLIKETYLEQDLTTWTATNVSIDSDGVATFSSSSSKLISDYIPVNGEMYYVIYDGYGTTVKSGSSYPRAYYFAYFYNEDMNATHANGNNATRRGQTPYIGLNEWKDNVDFYNGSIAKMGSEGRAGRLVKYVKISFEHSSTYSTYPYKLRNVKVYGSMPNSFYLIYPRMGDEREITLIKYANGIHDLDYFSSNGTISNERKIRVTENGDYTVYVEDNAGHAYVKTITIDNIV